MNPLNVLIIDDEEPALNRLVKLLGSYKDFTVVAACTNPYEALNILRCKPVDLLLLDIEMPGMNGLELLNNAGNENKPLVVFVTAYDEYAVQAFEYYAIDYILKPFANERFEKMLLRVKEHFISHVKSNISWAEVTSTIEHGTIPGRITVKTGKKYHFITPGEIAYISANGNYCELILINGSKHIHRDTITHLLTVLPSSEFIRIHHSHIVAIKSVAEAKRLSFGELELKVTGDVWLKVSRKYKHLVKRLIKY